MNGLDREETLAASVTHPSMLEYLPLEDALKALTFRYAPYMEVFNGAFPPHPIIQLDGDFTVDELRKIVAACDAAMGEGEEPSITIPLSTFKFLTDDPKRGEFKAIPRQVLETIRETRTFGEGAGRRVNSRIKPHATILDDENEALFWNEPS
jgi:hypothetical protein